MSLFDSASLVVTPNGYKEDKLYSIKPTDGSGDLVVTRATTATRVNSDGLIEQVPYNLLTYSNTFTNADWGNNQGTLTSGQNGYDGSSNAYKLQATGTSCYIVQGSYNFTRYQSVYAKAGNYSQISFIVGGYGNGVRFNLTNGTVADNTNTSYFTPTIESVGNGWYLCSVAISSTAPTYGFLLAPNYVAGGNSNSGDYIYIQNAQLVEGTSAKEYFPTTDRLDVPRLDYTNSTCPSILVEPQRTNLLTYSEQFDNAAWTKRSNVTIDSNSTTSPDGTTNADKIRITNNSDVDYGVLSIKTSGSYSFSVFAKKAEIGYLFIGKDNSYASDGVFFNLNNGTISQNTGSFVSSIEDYGNGWYRCTAYFPTISYCFISPSVSGTSFTFNNQQNNGLYIWGAQLEAGSYATSYIPTIASSVTRNADVISKTGISSLIGQTEGTVYIDYIPKSNYSLSEQNLLTLYNSSSIDNNNIQFFVNSSQQIVIYVLSSGSVVANINTGVSALNSHKVAVGYKANDLIVYIDGIQVGSDTSLTIPVLNSIVLNNYAVGNYMSASAFKSAILWKTRLTNSELAQLTTI